MGRKLRGMQSLLALEEGQIDIHHRSFLDFLQDVSRSGQYHIDERASSKRYMELITDVIVRFVSGVIDQPQCHDTQHLHLQYYWSGHIDLEPELVDEDLREVLQPLVDLQDKLLNLPNFTSSRNILPCDECNVFQITRNLLLHLTFRQAKSHCIASSTEATGSLMLEQEGGYGTIAALPNIETENNGSHNDLDTDFASLLAYMRNTPVSISEDKQPNALTGHLVDIIPNSIRS
ncbi:hypothetical protein M378DRAFT_346495 [Amanita muscaria Koide BX008]|uniref:Uncharacterized protein n=1 Tax=Amanita muscaria (strain Koide BX008) TaxID=946122 RepID=A0A0C2W9Y3_AMAMK|nr:hypothetical protein M378DRAFT_346495 [Amanita muscaria Koide BX008]